MNWNGVPRLGDAHPQRGAGTVAASSDRKGDQFTEAVLGSRWIEPSADTIPSRFAWLGRQRHQRHYFDPKRL